MGLLPKLRQLMKRTSSASTVGIRRPTSAARPGDRPHEDALRAMLTDDPNNERAFRALVEIVRKRAATTGESDDPLSADVADESAQDERRRRGQLAVWALAEELAGNPRAWYPLVELARLSLDDDFEGAMRRLATAAERDHSGSALAAGVTMLRETGRPADAVGLGVGHWRSKEHIVEVGRQLVLASLDAGRVGEAKHHLDALELNEDKAAVARVVGELRTKIAMSESGVAES